MMIVKTSQIVFTTIDLERNIVAREYSGDKKRITAYSVVYPGSNGNGFYVVQPALVKNKVRGHYLEKIDNNLKKEWSVEDVTDKGYVGSLPTLVNNDDRVVVWREHGKGINKLKPQIIAMTQVLEKPYLRDGYDGESKYFTIK